MQAAGVVSYSTGSWANKLCVLVKLQPWLSAALPGSNPSQE